MQFERTALGPYKKCTHFESKQNTYDRKQKEVKKTLHICSHWRGYNIRRDRKKRSLCRIKRCSSWRGAFPAKITPSDLRSFIKRRFSLQRGAHYQRFYCMQFIMTVTMNRSLTALLLVDMHPSSITESDCFRLI